MSQLLRNFDPRMTIDVWPDLDAKFALGDAVYLAANMGKVTSVPNGQLFGMVRAHLPDGRIEVQNRMVLSSTQAASGQNITVTFSVPYTSTPNVTITALNPANANNGFAYINTISLTGFTATVGASGLTVHWIASGTNNRGL